MVRTRLRARRTGTCRRRSRRWSSSESPRAISAGRSRIRRRTAAATSRRSRSTCPKTSSCSGAGTPAPAALPFRSRTTGSSRRSARGSRPARPARRRDASEACCSLARMKRFAAVLALVWAAHPALADDLHERALALQKSAIVVDTHEDVPEELQKKWADLAVRGATPQVDIPRWREGGVTAPFLAAYVSADFATSGGSAMKALEFIDLIHRLVEAHPNDLVFADSVEGIRNAKKDG